MIVDCIYMSYFATWISTTAKYIAKKIQAVGSIAYQ